METPVLIAALVGRTLFGMLFVGSAIAHFAQPDRFIAQATDRKLTAPRAMTAGSGVVLLVAGAMLQLGIYPDVGAALLVMFLLPAAFLIHPFWRVAPHDREAEQVQFLKDLALAGAALTMLAMLAAGTDWGPSFTSTLLGS